MSREADYTIKGFLYQFNKTLLEVLNASADACITVEGLIEDIDVELEDRIEAIQVKYHEAQEAFALSVIYKPVLQMMQHYCEHSTWNVRYRLYAFFPDQIPGSTHAITEEELTTVTKTTNKKLENAARSVKDSIDIPRFKERFSIEFGKPFDELVIDVKGALLQNGLPNDQIEPLFYPNAVQHISSKSITHGVSNRTITKRELIDQLKSIHSTAVSRWTLSLKSATQVLKAKRTQLKSNLSRNARCRHFLLSSATLDEFSAQIVTFIKDFVEKYHFKKAHTETPLFCLDCAQDVFDDIRLRLHRNGIRATDGYIGPHFDSAELFRQPLFSSPNNRLRREFDIRLVRYVDDASLLILQRNGLALAELGGLAKLTALEV